MAWKSHWQPKDRKEDMANDILEWARRVSGDDKLELPTLTNMSYRDLSNFMLAVRQAEIAYDRCA